MENLQLVFPEIFLSLSIMFLLLLGVFKKDSSKLIQNISLVILLITAVITFNETITIDEVKLFNGSMIIDYLSSFMKIVTLLAAFLALVISSNYLKTFKIFKIEYPILILSSESNGIFTISFQMSIFSIPSFSTISLEVFSSSFISSKLFFFYAFNLFI